jgi:hypothetical protein
MLIPCAGHYASRVAKLGNTLICLYTVYIHNGTFQLKYALRDILGISNGSFVMKRMSTSEKAT